MFGRNPAPQMEARLHRVIALREAAARTAELSGTDLACL